MQPSYPNNIDFSSSEDNLSVFSFNFWQAGDYDDDISPLSVYQAPLNDELDAFEELSSTHEVLDTQSSEDEMSYPDSPPAPVTVVPSAPQPQQVPIHHSAYLQYQFQQFLLHQQQLQFQQLQLQQQQQQQQQQQLQMAQSYVPMPPIFYPSPPAYPEVHQTQSALEGYHYEAPPAYKEPLNNIACQAQSAPLDSSCDPRLTQLDANHFSTNSSLQRLKSIPIDISGNLSEAQYHSIFKKYHHQLHLEMHPIMTEKDLEDIKIHGRIYFLKNVKTIVPKVGPWKFNAHVSHRRTDERQYNIPGMTVTCKVKEWMTDDGLWRMYHFKKGKTVKPRDGSA